MHKEMTDEAIVQDVLGAADSSDDNGETELHLAARVPFANEVLDMFNILSAYAGAQEGNDALGVV